MKKNYITAYFKSNYGYLTFTVLGVLGIPSLFFLFNAAELHYDRFLLYPFIIISLAILLVGLLINIIGLLYINSFNRFNDVIQKIFFSLGIIILVNDVFAPTQAGQLNGELQSIPEPYIFTILEIFTTISVFYYVFIKIKNNQSLVGFSKLISPLFAIILIMLVYFKQLNNEEQISISSGPTKNISSELISSPNIYLLWLDSMQTDYFIKYIKDNERQSSFKGFTIFEKNIANYMYSLSSSMSFMNGSFNEGQGYKEWNKKNYFRKKLKQKSYYSSTYGRSVLLSPLDNVRNDLNSVIKEAKQLDHPDISDFVRYSLVKMSPNFLANESLAYSQHIADYIFDKFNPNAMDNRASTIKNGLHTAGSVYMFNKAIKDEAERRSTNEFVMLQVLIPHSPLVLNENCEYIGLRKGESHDKYLLQTGCAVNIVDKFLIQLKELNRFDNSLIIVMGDHGDGRPKMMFSGKKLIKKPMNEKISHMPEQRIIARAHALLMIKPPNAKNGSLKISKLKSQLIDIVPTIYGLLGWKKDQRMHGQNLFSDLYENLNQKIILFKSPYSKNIPDAEVYQVNRGVEKGDIKLEYLNSEKNHFKQ